MINGDFSVINGLRRRIIGIWSWDMSGGTLFGVIKSWLLRIDVFSDSRRVDSMKFRRSDASFEGLQKAGWWFGTSIWHFPINIGFLIIPIDVHIFQRGGWTTNQKMMTSYYIILDPRCANTIQYWSKVFFVYLLLYKGKGIGGHCSW